MMPTATDTQDPYADMTDEEYDNLRGGRVNPDWFVTGYTREAALAEMERLLASMRRVYGPGLGNGEAA